MQYHEVLSNIHKYMKPKTYLEIGVRHGESLQYAWGKTRCIAIDPEYDIKYPYCHDTLFYKQTSDQFFESGEAERLFERSKIDLSFIDGMHLFEFVLRDFINVERFSGSTSVIVLHDCLARDEETSSRERKTDFWTGDVWKVIKVLEKYRPDLKITILDAEPSGLAIITNLDPSSTVLNNGYDHIVKEFIEVRLSTFVNTTNKVESFRYKELPGGKSNELLSSIGAKLSRKPRCIAVLLCYNDSDILEDALRYYLKNNHKIIAWDHGSSDRTSEILDRYQGKLLERKYVPREFDFYQLYPAMSLHLMSYYTDNHDWVSWPDQDEILEGPDRKKSYYRHLVDVYRGKHDWIQFNNFNYWFTNQDDQELESPLLRIRHYALFPDCAPRIRSWRSSATNIREFNHNPPQGSKLLGNFNLRHYPMRSLAQARKRLGVDRAEISRGESNVHYKKMSQKMDLLIIDPSILHFDNGEELKKDCPIDWKKIYF